MNASVSLEKYYYAGSLLLVRVIFDIMCYLDVRLKLSNLPLPLSFQTTQIDSIHNFSCS